MTPAPPLPSAAAGLLQSSSGVNRWLDHLGAEIGTSLMHAHSPAVVHVSAVHSPHLAPLAAGATLIATGSAGLWWGSRCDLAFAGERLRGLVSPRVVLERRRWNKMCKKIFPASSNPFSKGVPPEFKPIGGHPTRAGATLTLRMDHGANVVMLENPKLLAAMASTLNRPVQITPVYLKPRYCTATLQAKDVFAKTLPWPWLDQEATNFFGPVPVAVDLEGRTVTVDYREHHELVAGESGSGKSEHLHVVVAAAMGDTRVRVHIFDGKMGTGFRAWRDACETFLTNDVDDVPKVVAAFEKLTNRVNKIYKRFEQDQRTIDWDTVEVADLVVVDEPDAFPPVIWRHLLTLNRRGRAAGCMTVLAMQRPSSKAMDTDLRALYHIRAVGRLDPAGVVMGLGESYRGYETASFKYPGQMWLIPDDRTPVQCRGFRLTDADLARLAERATRLRSNQDRPNPASASGDPPTAPFANVAAARPMGEPPDLSAKAPEASNPPRTALLPYQRQALALVNSLGPQITMRDLAPHLPSTDGTVGLSERSAQRRIDSLEKRGLVFSARRAHRPGEARGNGDPKLWSVTPAGAELLSDTTPRKEAGDVQEPGQDAP